MGRDPQDGPGPARSLEMTVEKGVRLVAGTLTLIGVATAHPQCPLFVSPHMLWLPAFVGFMLAQSAFTGFCPAALILKALGLKPAAGA
jgi:hypothetical protein